MQVNPEKKTIKELLKSQKQFVIPRFQREFVWDKKQYVTFIEDILSSISFENGTVTNSQYFIGTMLYVGNFSDATCRELKVVDGQQRLTTITILFSSLARTFKTIGDEQLAKILFEYVMTKDDDGKDIRILKTETSHPFFADFVQRLDGHELKIETEEEENIKQVHDYYCNLLKENNLRKAIYKLHGDISFDISYTDILKAIRDEVLNCLAICITTNNNEDASKLFEILNGKGKSLNYIDLIKNRLFDTLNETEPSDYANEQWKKLKQNLSFDDGFVETFVYVRHYWLSTRGMAQKSNLFERFSGIKKKKYKDFLTDLVLNSNYYQLTLSPNIRYFDNRSEYKRLIQALNNINHFNVIQYRIAVMALLDLYNRNLIHQNKLTEAVIFLQHFHFAYNSVMRQRPNKLDKIYSKFAIELRKIQNSSDVTLTIQNSLYKPLSELLPSYNNFRNEFIRLTYKKENHPDNIKSKFAINMINTLYSGNTLFPENGSIEHIIPESTGDKTCSIGNLILLEEPLNNKAGIKPYIDKKEIYKISDYKWISKFAKDNNDFDLGMIDDRANKLAEIYFESFLKPYKDKYANNTYNV